MHTPGPVATNPFGSRLPLERGRDAMDISKRQFVIAMKRDEAADAKLKDEAFDALACQLLSYSAALIERRQFKDANVALVDADQQLQAAMQWQAVAFPNMPITPRLGILRAACRYNMAVMFYELDDAETGYQYFRQARDGMARVPDKNRADELFTTLESALDQLGDLVGI